MTRDDGFWLAVERAFDEVQRELNGALDRQHTYGVERLADTGSLRAARVSVRDAGFYHSEVDRRILDVTVRDDGDGVAYHVSPPPVEAATAWDRYDDGTMRDGYAVLVTRLLDRALE